MIIIITYASSESQIFHPQDRLLSYIHCPPHRQPGSDAANCQALLVEHPAHAGRQRCVGGCVLVVVLVVVLVAVLWLGAKRGQPAGTAQVVRGGGAVVVLVVAQSPCKQKKAC